MHKRIMLEEKNFNIYLTWKDYDLYNYSSKTNAMYAKI